MNYLKMKEGKSMYFNIEFPNKMAHAYSVMCKPLCQVNITEWQGHSIR